MRGEAAPGDGRLIDELCVLGDFERKYALKVLRRQRRKNRASARGKKSVRYGKEVQRVLEVIWRQSEQMCGKRLERELDPFALKASVERQLREIFKLQRQLQATRQEAA